MIPLAFQGGTSLRFLYSIPRSSEDLDFALEQSGCMSLEKVVSTLLSAGNSHD